MRGALPCSKGGCPSFSLAGLGLHNEKVGVHNWASHNPAFPTLPVQQDTHKQLVEVQG